MELWRPKEENYDLGNMQNGSDFLERCVRR